jgi:hypothetical protein
VLPAAGRVNFEMLEGAKVHASSSDDTEIGNDAPASSPLLFQT